MEAKDDLLQPSGPSGKAIVGAISAVVAGAAALPQAFEQYPYGAAVVVALALYGGACSMYWARMKYRRR
jgi:hypothetical protein